MERLYYPNEHAAAKYMKDVLMKAQVFSNQSRKITIVHEGDLPIPFQILAETISEITRSHWTKNSRVGLDKNFCKHSRIPLTHSISPSIESQPDKTKLHLTISCVTNLAKALGIGPTKNPDRLAMFRKKFPLREALKILSYETDIFTKKLLEIKEAEKLVLEENAALKRMAMDFGIPLPLESAEFHIARIVDPLRKALPECSVLEAITGSCNKLALRPCKLIITNLNFLSVQALRHQLCSLLRQKGVNAFLPSILTETDLFKKEPYGSDFQWDSSHKTLSLGPSFTKILFDETLANTEDEPNPSLTYTISINSLSQKELAVFSSFTCKYATIVETITAARFQDLVTYNQILKKLIKKRDLELSQRDQSLDVSPQQHPNQPKATPSPVLQGYIGSVSRTQIFQKRRRDFELPQNRALLETGEILGNLKMGPPSFSAASFSSTSTEAVSSRLLPTQAVPPNPLETEALDNSLPWETEDLDYPPPWANPSTASASSLSEKTTHFMEEPQEESDLPTRVYAASRPNQPVRQERFSPSEKQVQSDGFEKTEIPDELDDPLQAYLERMNRKRTCSSLSSLEDGPNLKTPKHPGHNIASSTKY